MSSSSKRKVQDSDETISTKKTKNEDCPHGDRCHSRNPHHFKEYEHPHLIEFINKGDSFDLPENLPQPKNIYLEQMEVLKPMLKSESDAHSKPSTSDSKGVSSKGKTTSHSSTVDLTVTCKPGTMLEKLERAAPYNLFYNTISYAAPETLKQPNAIAFTDLLCPSLGDLKCSLQLTFKIDIKWLLKQYRARHLQKKPLSIIYGDWVCMEQFNNAFYPNVCYEFLKPKARKRSGIHNSKIGIYVYEDWSLRVVVSTANLNYADWNYYNQGLWLSPACRRLPKSSPDTDGESPTGFKSSLLNYLKTYDVVHVKQYMKYVQRCDFSDVKVFLTYSVPGKHYPNGTGSHLFQVGDLLSRHCCLPEKTTPASEGPLSWGVIAQVSCIGALGKKPTHWLRRSILRSLASHTKSPMPMISNASISIVYPSDDNVLDGHYHEDVGFCLPYSRSTHDKQKWLKYYLHQWEAWEYGRTRAMPHIKTYCRVSPCLEKLAYFLITSANLSKAAWGEPITKENLSYARSFEVGVLFLPKFFGEEHFEILLEEHNKSLFPFMYDLPLKPYTRFDYPWVIV